MSYPGNAFVLISRAVHRISCSSNVNGLWDGRKLAVLLLFLRGVNPRICSKQHAVFLCSYHLAFSPHVFLAFNLVIHRVYGRSNILEEINLIHFIWEIRLPCDWQIVNNIPRFRYAHVDMKRFNHFFLHLTPSNIKGSWKLNNNNNIN